jgi:hypothetical protein
MSAHGALLPVVEGICPQAGIAGGGADVVVVVVVVGRVLMHMPD